MTSPLTINPASVAFLEARRRIFESVFPPNVSATLPTPASTPLSSFAGPAFHAAPAAPPHPYNTRHHPQPSEPAVSLLPSPSTILARNLQAWHLATTYLSFPDAAFPATPIEFIRSTGPPRKDEADAIAYLLLNNDDGYVDGRENLVEWYVCEVRRHFLHWVKPVCQLHTVESYESPSESLESILKKLTAAQNIYLHRLKTYLLLNPGDSSPRKPSRGKGKKKASNRIDDNHPRVVTFVQSLNSIISYSLPDPAWSDLVYAVFLEHCGLAVGVSKGEAEEDYEEVDLSGEEEECEGENEEGGNSPMIDDDDDAVYDQLPQSFTTETDLDGDMIVATDEGDPINPAKLDGISDFEDFKNQPRERRAVARKKVLQLWGAMERIGVGGGGRRGERVFAEVINTLLTAYIHQTFAGKWESPSSAAADLEDWVETVLGRLIVDVLFSSVTRSSTGDARLDKLSPRESLRASRQSLDKRRKGMMEVDDGVGAGEEERKRRIEDLDSWKKIAIDRLGRLRVSELFDIVVDWPISLGGVEDLKPYITTPQTRLHLTTTFTAQINQRILHPAAATSDILAAYIRLVRAFAVPDPRGVLLDRVSRGIRRYLRERDDTVKVIIRGIMSESLLPSSEGGEELSELASELSKGIPALVASMGGAEDLDYDDMSWVPDPIDAGPEFRRNKGLDVVGSLLSLWESKEVWMKEVQLVLSARLLHDSTYDFDKEIRTVELLKLRFGEPATQSLDVMLKDMADSKRIDTTITDGRNPHAPSVHAKILSRLFWPNLKDKEFNPPPEVAHAMEHYQKGFEKLKGKRKLDWIKTAGTVELEIELEDRIVAIPDATPVQAAVIGAFDSGDEKRASTSISITTLAEMFSLSQGTLRSALNFWVDQGVLREQSSGLFTVIESLNSAPPSPALQPQPQQVVEEQAQEMDEEKVAQRQMVEQYVVHMLTNGGTMPVDRIMMVLGMLIPGGLTWSIEELKEFLSEMKDKGRIEAAPNGWKIV